MVGPENTTKWYLVKLGQYSRRLLLFGINFAAFIVIIFVNGKNCFTDD